MADGLIFGTAPFLTLFCGAKHSGKTQCIKYVCRAYSHVFASIIVFCPTALTGAYDFLPKKNVFDDYSEELMRGIMARQEEYKRAGKDVQVLYMISVLHDWQTSYLYQHTRWEDKEQTTLETQQILKLTKT